MGGPVLHSKVATVAATNTFLELVTAFDAADLGPGPRSGALPLAELDKRLTTLLDRQALSATSEQLARALILLWHDHLDTAHTIAQDIPNPDGSLVHAIMHRREPDYWNSKYWWRRVGEHPCFPALAQRVTTFLRTNGGDQLLDELVVEQKWNPFAHVDACEAAAALKPDSELVRILRAVQKIEFETALAHFLGDKAH